jgi:uncharacterized membrane protein YfhO
MTVTVDPAMPGDGYLVVSENWYPDWHATIDGEAGTALRGDMSLLTVPLQRGARQVELAFRSSDYLLGRSLTGASLGLVALGFIVPVLVRRRRAHG